MAVPDYKKLRQELPEESDKNLDASRMCTI